MTKDELKRAAQDIGMTKASGKNQSAGIVTAALLFVLLAGWAIYVIVRKKPAKR
jgi:hypothetical protein